MAFRFQGLRLLLLAGVLGAEFLPLGPNANVLASSLSEAPAQKIALKEFLQKVAAHHPEHGIDLLDLERAQVALEKVGLLSDPTVSLARERTPFAPALQSREVRERMDDTNNDASWTLTASQTFPWPGTLDAAKQAAQKKLEVAAIRIDAAHALRVLEAEEVFLNLLTQSRLIAVEQENLREADRILNSASARLAHGVGNQFETLSAQSEKTLLALNIDTLTAELENLGLFAKQLMGIPLDQKIEFDLSTQKSVLAQAPVPHEMLLAPGNAASDFKTRPLELAASAENFRLEAERKVSMPEFMTSVMLMRDDTGMRMYGAMIGIRIPLFSGSVRNALKSEESLVVQKSQKEIAWHTEKKALAFAQVQRRSEVLKKNFEVLKKELIPLATQRLSAGLTEYAQGRGNLGNVNESRRALLRFKSAQINLERDLSLAELAKERIAAGFGDGEINAPMPSLPGSSLSEGAMATQAMPQQMSSSPMKKGLPNAAKSEGAAGSRSRPMPQRSSPEWDEPNPAPGSTANGMGM